MSAHKNVDPITQEPLSIPEEYMCKAQKHTLSDGGTCIWEPQCKTTYGSRCLEDVETTVSRGVLPIHNQMLIHNQIHPPTLVHAQTCMSTITGEDILGPKHTRAAGVDVWPKSHRQSCRQHITFSPETHTWPWYILEYTMIPTTSRYHRVPQAQTSFMHMKRTTTSTPSQDNPFPSPSPSLTPTQASLIATRIKKKQGTNVVIILLLHTQQHIQGLRISLS